MGGRNRKWGLLGRRAGTERWVHLRTEGEGDVNVFSKDLSLGWWEIPHTERGQAGGVSSFRQILNPPLDMLSLGFRCNTEAKRQGGERLESITKKYRPRNGWDLRRRTLKGKEKGTKILGMTRFQKKRKKRIEDGIRLSGSYIDTLSKLQKIIWERSQTQHVIFCMHLHTAGACGWHPAHVLTHLCTSVSLIVVTICFAHHYLISWLLIVHPPTPSPHLNAYSESSSTTWPNLRFQSDLHGSTTHRCSPASRPVPTVGSPCPRAVLRL